MPDDSETIILEQYRETVFGTRNTKQRIAPATDAEMHHQRFANIAGLSDIVRSRVLE